MNNDLIAKAHVSVQAPVDKVWDALVNPDMIRQYMFGTSVVSDWKEGVPITWSGEWEGKPYQDKGIILRLEPMRVLEYSHFSPLAGQPDTPENYHTVTIELSRVESGSLVTLRQDKNASEEERQHSQDNWQMMLTGLKRVVESSQSTALAIVA